MPVNRRDFLKNAAVFAAATGLTNMKTGAIEKAFSISADKGTTFYDAEHIVFLMQENRSFDHIFGCMKGVRGFNDPRAKWLPDGNKVWVQKAKDGKAQAPFHLDMHKTSITWQGGLPHDWPDQSGARNNGKYDTWIPHKTAMAMGYYNRQDMPFYYALADAFTICDHYFCSSLTGTTPNRLFFWTGNVRPIPNGNSIPVLRNSMAESRNNVFVDWETYPELLEDNGISWKIYQNELWTTKLEDKTDYWLGNYGDNAIEYVKRHHVKLSAYFRKNGDATQQPALTAAQVMERYGKLSVKEKNLIDKAFTTNIDADDYLALEPLHFINSQGENSTVTIPKGDIFHQFRKDVEGGTLPTVSWLVAPESFSDHTSSPFYGTWYVSEALDILTQNAEVWKKTIFILNYDENDGYYDHLPPYVVPGGVGTGKVSDGIDTASDYDPVTNAPIGLGYRVPMIIASPWSRGGYVNSEVFDHTSALMFLENFLYKKTGKKIYCPNISSWRRAVCGDLSSAFRPYNGQKIALPDFLKKEQVITDIQNAKSNPKQLVPEPLTPVAIKAVNNHPDFLNPCTAILPMQENGVRPACAIPYRLQATCKLDIETRQVMLSLAAEQVGETGKGSAFNAYTRNSYGGDKGKTWAYAVLPMKPLVDNFELQKFENEKYNLCVDGPNGFFREFTGDANDPLIEIGFEYIQKGFFKKKPVQKINLHIKNHATTELTILLEDNAYKMPTHSVLIPGNASKKIKLNLARSSGWYDFSLKVKDNGVFLQRFAGHVETGEGSITDPYMDGAI